MFDDVMKMISPMLIGVTLSTFMTMFVVVNPLPQIIAFSISFSSLVIYGIRCAMRRRHTDNN